MQNTSVQTNKSAMLNPISPSTKTEPIKPMEGMNSFQQMFAKQLQHDEAQTQANNKMNQQRHAESAEQKTSAASGTTEVAKPASEAARADASQQTEEAKSEADQTKQTKIAKDKHQPAQAAAKQPKADDVEKSDATASLSDVIAQGNFRKVKAEKLEEVSTTANAEKSPTELTLSPQDAALLAGLQVNVTAQLPKDNTNTELTQTAQTELASSAQQTLNGMLGKQAIGKQSIDDSVPKEVRGQGDDASGETRASLNADEHDRSALIKSDLLKDNANKQQWLESVLAKVGKAAETESTASNSAFDKISQAIANAAPAAMYQATSGLTNANAVSQAGASNLINVYPGKTGWDQAIGQKVIWMVNEGEQSATLNLNPPDLGPLQVVINVNNDKADTTFISQNPEVRQALEDGMSTLRDMMGKAGIELGQSNVNSGNPQQQAFEQTNQRLGSGVRQAQKEAHLPVDAQPARATMVRAGLGAVDTFV